METGASDCHVFVTSFSGVGLCVCVCVCVCMTQREKENECNDYGDVCDGVK